MQAASSKAAQQHHEALSSIARPPRTHRRASVAAWATSRQESHSPLCGPGLAAPHHTQHQHQHLPAPQAAAAATCSTSAPLGQQGPQHQEQGALTLRPGRLAKAVKMTRKQLERQTTRCGFVVDEARGTEDAAIQQLLLELRRMELHQLSPAGDGCSTLPIPVPLASSTTAPQPQRAVVVVEDDEDPWGAGLDLSSELYAPRAYQVPGRVLVCQGSKCRAKGALGVLQAVSAVTAGCESVQVLPCKCLGKCKEGAVMRVKQDGTPNCGVYTRLAPDQVPDILDTHFLQPATPEEPEPLPVVASACCTDCQTPSTL